MDTNQNLKNAMFFNILSWMSHKFLTEGNTDMAVDELSMYVESKIVIEKAHLLIETDSNFICEKLAYYLGELNVVHPFREGNGRAQRVYIECLALVCGYHVDFSNISGHQMIEASVEAFNCNYSKMIATFDKITTPISTEEQIQQINSIMPFAMKFLEEISNECENECELDEEIDMHI